MSEMKETKMSKNKPESKPSREAPAVGPAKKPVESESKPPVEAPVKSKNAKLEKLVNMVPAGVHLSEKADLLWVNEDGSIYLDAARGMDGIKPGGGNPEEAALKLFQQIVEAAIGN